MLTESPMYKNHWVALTSGTPMPSSGRLKTRKRDYKFCSRRFLPCRAYPNFSGRRSVCLGRRILVYQETGTTDIPPGLEEQTRSAGEVLRS